MVKIITAKGPDDFKGFVSVRDDGFVVIPDTLTLFDDDEAQDIIDQLVTVFNPIVWAFEIKDVR